jgi:microcystin-dependent protein
MNASNSTNPNSLLGFGTWVAFGEGNVTVGYKSGDADFGTAGGTGGAKTHTLTEAEMPEHKHLSPNKDCNSYSGVYGTDAGTVNTWCDTNGIQTSSSAPYGQPKGGDGAHNNLQPYITVYMWNRTG